MAKYLANGLKTTWSIQVGRISGTCSEDSVSWRFAISILLGGAACFSAAIPGLFLDRF